MSGTEDWKRRYLTEAGAWETTEKRLRRAIGRVAIAGEGHSAALDEALARVQRFARGGADDDLDREVDQLTQIIRRLDTERSAAAAAAVAESPAAPTTASPADFCARLIDALEISPERAAGLKAFRERLAELQPEQCLARLALEITATLREEAPRVDGNVQEVLRALVDEVAVVQPELGSLQTLRDALQRDAGGDWHSVLSRIIGEIRGIIERISADKHALEALVQQVSSELGDITGVLLSDQAGLQSGRQESEKLHELMHAGVTRIQEHIETESDLDRLKEGVSHSLEGIRVAITEFAEGDARRLAEAEARNEELQQRVTRMEQESADLHKRVQRNRDQLMQDTLTGVRSRLAYDESLAQELNRFHRYKDVFTLVVFDIDHFKRVNDGYGHHAGDKALKLVARLIGERIRETDQLFRVGGEEFVLLLPNTGLSAARPLVEEVRAAVGSSDFHFEGKPVQITLSAGLTAVHEDDTADTIFARADDAMYRAKRGGRDRLAVLD